MPPPDRTFSSSIALPHSMMTALEEPKKPAFKEQASAFEQAWPKLMAIPDELLHTQGIDPAEFREHLEREKEPCKKFLTAVEEQCKLLNAKNPYRKPEECARRLARMMSILCHHRNQKRKSQGNPLYSIHLWETATILVQNSFLEADLHEKALAHDAVEDIAEVREQHVPLLYEFGFEKPSTRNREIREEQIRRVIAVVSKPEIEGEKTPEKKRRQSEEYMKILIEGGLEYPHALLIKLADRLSNSRDEFIKAEETLEVFYPLAMRFGLEEIAEELLRNAVNKLNPQLIKDFDEAMQQRVQMARTHPFMKITMQHLEPLPERDRAIEDRFIQQILRDNRLQIAQTITSDQIARRFIRRAEFEPHKFSEYFNTAPRSIDVRALTLADLKIPKWDSMVDIVVEVRSSEMVGPVITYLQTLPHEGEWKIKWDEDRRSALAKTKGRFFDGVSGKAVFRILSTRRRHWNRRGCFPGFNDFNVPPDVRGDMNAVLDDAKDSGRDITEVAREKLFYPFITFSLCVDGKDMINPIKIPRGSTVEEAIQRVKAESHGKSFRYLGVIKNTMSNRWEENILNLPLSEPMPDNHVLVFESA